MSRTQGRLNLGGVNGMGATKFECQPSWDEERGEVGELVRVGGWVDGWVAGWLGGCVFDYVREKSSKLEFMPVGSVKSSSGISENTC